MTKKTTDSSTALATAPPDVPRPPAVDIGMLRYDEIPPALAEVIRSMINRYELRQNQSFASTIAVTGPLRGEGVTTVSQAMATVLAHETGRTVCWVDCSWLSPDHADRDGFSRPSLVDILADRTNILSAFQASPENPNLITLQAGPVPESKRNRIARSPEFDRLLDVLTEEFDHVIFDIPSVLEHASGLTLVRRADVSLLVVRHRSSTVTQVEKALEATQPTPNLGVIVNRRRTSIPRRLRRILGE